MDENIWRFLEPLIIERLGKIFLDNEEYKQTIEREAKSFEELWKNLTREQQKQLNEYSHITNYTAVITKKIAYQQGIKDLIELIGELMLKHQD